MSANEVLNLSILNEKIKKGNITEIAVYLNLHNLTIDGNKIVPKDRKQYEKHVEFWEKRQYVRKILLNSLYGCILNSASRFYDHRIGQSVTLTGRCITRHMISEINQNLTGKYDHLGDAIIYGDTDSVHANSIINTTLGQIAVEDLFHSAPIKWQDGEKEYAVDERVQVATFDPDDNIDKFEQINYIYRHRVNKEAWRITDEDGNEIIITEDHSVMIERNGEIIAVKPTEILEDDLLIGVNDA
ncbi:MAG: hypothetical protein HC836_22840 [Richelia sp. RM2_1_2]|nr:hypothetical protein [Richelia sp. RM2_1_2]